MYSLRPHTLQPVRIILRIKVISWTLEKLLCTEAKYVIELMAKLYFTVRKYKLSMIFRTMDNETDNLSLSKLKISEWKYMVSTP